MGLEDGKFNRNTQRDLVLSRALIEGIVNRSNGTIPTTDLAKRIREALSAAAKELEIPGLTNAMRQDLLSSERSPTTYGIFTYDPEERLLTAKGRLATVELSRTQGRLFDSLLAMAPKVVTYERLTDACWGDKDEPGNLKVTVYQIRKKISVFPEARIGTKAKTGYSFQEIS